MAAPPNRPSAWRAWLKPRRDRFIKWAHRQFCRLPLSRRLVLCEAGWGASYSCNPRGISEYLMTRADPRWTLVWAFTNPRAVQVPRGVIKVRYGGLAFHYVAARAGVLITNVNFADHIAKRPGALHIQTMHGTPIKTLGLDIPGEFKSQRGKDAFLRRNRRWDYLLAPSQYTADCAQRAFQHRATVLPFGYPRNDVLVAAHSPDRIRRVREGIGIPASRRVILYAPTWRGGGTESLGDGVAGFVDWFRRTDPCGGRYALLVRMHPLTKVRPAAAAEAGTGCVIDVSSYPDNRELMLLADVLVTDYSSIVFDFGLLERPVALYCFDYDHYVHESRGVYMDIVKESPWPTYRSIDELTAQLPTALDRPLDLEAHRRFMGRYAEWDRGNAAERLCREVLVPWRLAGSAAAVRAR